jgi:hypothetical protein
VKAAVSNFPGPRLARGWAIALYAPMVLLFLWMAWRSRSDLVAVLLFVGILTLVTVGALRILSTTISAGGASQLTLRGRVQMRWEDVRQVRDGAYGALTLKGDTGRIVIHCAFYRDFDETRKWLARRLSRVWPTGEGV